MKINLHAGKQKFVDYVRCVLTDVEAMEAGQERYIGLPWEEDERLKVYDNELAGQPSVESV